MANLSEDFQCAGSDTRPPMLDRTDFASWETLAEDEEGAFHLDYLIENITNTLSLLTQSYKTYLLLTNNQLRTSSNTRNQTTIQDSRVVVQNVQGRQNRGLGNNARVVGTAGYEGAQNRVGNANSGQARQIKCYNYNGIGHKARKCTQPKRPQNSKYFKDKMLMMQAQENREALDEEQLLFVAADDCDAFDSDVDEAPTTQTMFMANLSSTYHVYDEAGPYYDSDFLSEVHDHVHYQDAVCEHHEVHEMYDDAQPNYVVDSHVDYTSDSNMIPYDHYVKDNAVPVVQSNVSFIPNDAYMMILKDMHEQPAQHVTVTTHNNVVDNSLTTELATYKEQVKLYERQAKFEYTEREQKIDEQLRIVITDQETLEIAEITRKKINDKMKDPECVQKKVKIAPHDYSKENYLATFTLQKQLTPEQIFWSNDLLKMKEEALKEQIIASRPIKALMVKHDEIERKNILIANDNLIADCLSKDVFYTATVFVLTVSKFSDMHEALNVAQKRIAELESENSNLQNKIQNDDHDGMVNHFSKIEVEHLNLKLKYQHLKECFENKKLVTSSDAPTFDSVFVIGQLKDQVQSIGNTTHELREKISRLTKKHCDADPVHDLKALDSQNKELHAKVNALHDLNERWWAENEKVKRHYEELYDSIKIMRAKNIETTNSLLTEVTNLKAQIKENHKLNCVTMPAVKSKVLALGRYAIDVEPIPPRIRNNREANHLDYLKNLKESVETLREIVEEAKVERPLDRLLASACLYTKHSQELLEYVIGTCPKDFNQRDKKHAATPLTKKKLVTFMDPCETFTHNNLTYVKQQTINKTNEPVILSIGVKGATAASGSKPRSNTKTYMTLPAKMT
uniref:Integrase, catalytic region, zinc finger, CCHC-type, peptidase aspartic, catalytic n=1 Tax=Tanacetum cinerariifolium TaxID=118510 RepID=A0A699IAR2_TANCI|nr:hypothetical protein [Tanacetum cinerariifolium]